MSLSESFINMQIIMWCVYVLMYRTGRPHEPGTSQSWHDCRMCCGHDEPNPASLQRKKWREKGQSCYHVVLFMYLTRAIPFRTVSCPKTNKRDRLKWNRGKSYIPVSPIGAKVVNCNLNSLICRHLWSLNLGQSKGLEVPALLSVVSCRWLYWRPCLQTHSFCQIKSRSTASALLSVYAPWLQKYRQTP